MRLIITDRTKIIYSMYREGEVYNKRTEIHKYMVLVRGNRRSQYTDGDTQVYGTGQWQPTVTITWHVEIYYNPWQALFSFQFMSSKLCHLGTPHMMWGLPKIKTDTIGHSLEADGTQSDKTIKLLGNHAGIARLHTRSCIDLI